jgi:5-methylcytosine-specific restriction protein A
MACRHCQQARNLVSNIWRRTVPKLHTLRPLLRTTNTSTTPLVPRVKADEYTTPEFRAWRAQVLARAGWQCEAIDQHGCRCSNARPEHRIIADHIVELKDGGSLLDLNNGQALCKSHHERKTFAARARRRSSKVDGG